MLERLERELAEQLGFIADVSHELRNPLATARMSLDVALLRPRTADQWTLSAQVARRSLEEVSTLIDAMMQLARHGSEVLDAVPLADLLARAVAPLGPAIAVDVIGAPGLAVAGDPAALEVVLRHVVDGAVTTPRREGKVQIGCTRGGERIFIDVHGLGPPLGAADRERAFATPATGRDRHRNGTAVGLELAIARRIAEAHGGSLALQDVADGAWRFRIILAAARRRDPRVT